MNLKTYQLSLDFEQILELVKQLPQTDKIRLTTELEKETLEQKLTNFLNTFKTDEIDLEMITEEVEQVRSELYDKQQTL
jgi:hypothetical protein